MSEEWYPGQAYVHKHNANIKRAEERAMARNQDYKTDLYADLRDFDKAVEYVRACAIEGALDIALRDVLAANKGPHPGLGSGALREALKRTVNVADEVYGALRQFTDHAPDCDYHRTDSPHGDICVCRVQQRCREIKSLIDKTRKEVDALLSLSSPIEARDSRLLDALTELLSDTELVIHAPSQEWNSRWTDATHELNERRENHEWATPQAREALRDNLNRHYWRDGKGCLCGFWAGDYNTWLEHMIDALTAPSRQGAGGK